MDSFSGEIKVGSAAGAKIIEYPSDIYDEQKLKDIIITRLESFIKNTKATTFEVLINKES